MNIIADGGLTLTCKNCGATDCIGGDGYDPPLEDVMEWTEEFEHKHAECEGER